MTYSDFWTRHRSRRQVLAATAGASATLATLATVGCGSSSTGNSTHTPTTQTTGTQPSGTTATAAPKPGGTIKTPIIGDPPSLDPYLNLSYRSQGIASFVYSRLFKIESGPDIKPGDLRITTDVAASHETPDPLTFTVKLKPNVKWQDVPPLNGRPFTAADVKYTFERFMSLSPNRASLAPIDSLLIPDDHTVTFKLKAPTAPLQFYLGSPTHLYLMPREVIEADGDAAKRMIGTGPFILEKYQPSSIFQFRKNPSYYVEGQPYVDRTEWLIIADQATITANFRAGQVDIAGIPTADIDSLKKTNPDLSITSFQGYTCNSLWFDITKPPFNDVRVRQAASMAVDRQGLVDAAYNGKGSPQNAVPRGYEGWSLAPDAPEMGTAKQYLAHDPKAAKALLAQAGYTTPLTTNLNGTTGYGATNNQVMELLAEMLNQSGFKINLVMKEYAAHIATTFIGKFDGMAGGIGSTFFEPDDLFTNLYFSTSPRRNTLVTDTKLDNLIIKQRQELDIAKRKQIIYELQSYVVDQAYCPPTAAGDAFIGVAPWLKNTYPKATGDYDHAWKAKAWLDRK